MNSKGSNARKTGRLRRFIFKVMDGTEHTESVYADSIVKARMVLKGKYGGNVSYSIVRTEAW